MLDRTPVTQVVARRIQKMIRDGVYAPDTRLPSQRVLAEELQVSRASVREALLTLETLGLLVTLPSRGTYVIGPGIRAEASTPDPDVLGRDLSHVFETRAVLEGALAEGAARAMTDTLLTQIREAHQRFCSSWQAEDLVGHVEADLTFHRLIAEACPNPLLRQIYISVLDKLTESQRRPIPMTDADRMAASIREHEKLIEALAARDGKLASKAMKIHVAATALCAGVHLPIG